MTWHYSVSQVALLHVDHHITIIQYTSEKMLPTFRTLFQTCICSASAPQIGRFLLKKQKSSYKEHWPVYVYIQVSKMLCSFTYRFSRASFLSSGASFVSTGFVVVVVVVVEMQHSNGSGFCKHASFFLTCTCTLYRLSTIPMLLILLKTHYVYLSTCYNQLHFSSQ